MSNRHVLNFLFPDQPYFGGATAGIQGEYVRHVFMSAAISLKAAEESSLSILEIGSWTGASTLTWCMAMDTYCRDSGKILCVDPWSPYFSEEQANQGPHYRIMKQMAGLDIAYDLFQHNVNFAPSDVDVNHMRGKSTDILPYLQDQSFDVLYIDGDHAYESALFDIRAAKRLVKTGGFICGDDLEVQGIECDLDFIRDNLTFDLVTVPELDRYCHPGVTMAVHEEFGQVSAYHGFWIMRKTADDVFEPVSLIGQKSFIPTHFSEDQKEEVRQSLAKIGMSA